MKWLSLVLFLAITCVNAQDQIQPNNADESGNLEAVLFELQKRFGINCSYDSRLIETNNVSIKIDTTSLEANIKTIEKLTNIRFYEVELKSYILKEKPQTKTISICGYLINDKTNLPVSDAKISAKYQNTITNSNGYFTMDNISANSDLIIDKNGRTLKLISASNFKSSLCQNIRVNEGINILNEILIRNYISKGFSKNRNGSIQYLQKRTEVLPGLIAPDVLQSAQLIPGIQSPGETATGLFIRGNTPDHNLVVYDGIKIYNYNHFFGMLSVFNPYIVEKVQVGKGANSLKYRNHISGVLDITSFNDIPDQLEGGIGANMIYSDTFLKVPISKKIGLIVSSRTSYSELLQSVSFDAYSDFVFQNTKIKDQNNVFNQEISKVNSEFVFKDFTLKLISKINDKNHFCISTIHSSNKLDFQSRFREINQFTNDKLLIENLGLGMSYVTKWSNKLKSSFSTSFSDYHFNYKGEEVLNAFFDYETIKENRLKDLNISLDIDYKFNKNHSLFSGYDLVKNEIDYKISNISDVIFDSDFTLESEKNQNVSHEFFTEYALKKERLLVEGGLRTTYLTSLNKLYLQANFNTSYKLNSNLSFNFNLEKKNQFVSQINEFETQNLGLENQVWILSNNEIPVLEKRQLSFGLSYNKSKFYIDFEAYLKNTKGITSLTKGFNNEIEELTSGSSVTKGLELLLKKEINNFNASISYALTDNRFEFDNVNNGNEFQGNFDIRHYISVINSLKINDLELTAGWRFRTARPYTPVNGLIGNSAETIKIDFGPINSERLSNYNRFDVSAFYVFKPFSSKKIKGKIGASILNVFNKENNLSRSHRIVVDLNGPSYKIREINKFSLRRTPNLNLRLNF